MATPLTDQMNALLAYANGVTGGSDTKLGDAVRTLADGYGGGLPSGIKCGEFTPSDSALEYAFEHGCGTEPKSVVVICDYVLSTNVTGSMAMWVSCKPSGDISLQNYYARRNTSSGLLSMTSGGSACMTVTDTAVTLKGYNNTHYVRPYLHRWYAIY